MNVFYVILQRRKMAKYVPTYFVKTKARIPILLGFIPILNVYFLWSQIVLYEIKTEEYKELFLGLLKELGE